MVNCQPASEDTWRQKLWRIMRAALAAVDPEQAVLRFLGREGQHLRVGGTEYDLDRLERIYLVGAGKAAVPMAKAVCRLLGDALSAVVINVKRGYILPAEEMQAIQAGLRCPFEVIEAGHPTPDEAGLRGAQRMAQLLAGTTERDLVICVISGGGSALLTLPVEGVSLADLRALTDALLRSGATINEINTVRKHLSRVKGGGLARLAYPARVVALILSDVVGSPLDVIASGPTVPDPTTFADAWQVLARYSLLDKVPPQVRSYLERGVAGQAPETPKPGDPIFERVQNLIVGSNELAALAAVEQARKEGLNSLLLTTYLEGEAREVGKVAAALAKELLRNGRPLPCPACLVMGGETTVTVRGSGTGGRNQELALAAAIALAGWEGTMVGTLATDGSDGPTDAAGAIATGQTIYRAQQLGLNPFAFLENNDSYRFFQALGDLVVTGPTNTNVNDLLFILGWQAG